MAAPRCESCVNQLQSDAAVRLMCYSIVDSLWSSPPCVVDEFCYSVTSVEQLTAVNNVKLNKHIPVTRTVYMKRNFVSKQVLLV
jgi:hypothetical protein